MINADQHRSTIVLDYINKNNQVIQRKPLHGSVGQPFYLSRYVKTVPNDYLLDKVLLGNNVHKFSSDTQIIIIQLRHVKIRVHMMVQYRNHGRIVSHREVNGIVNSPFNVMPYTRMVPSNYHFVKISRSPKVFKKNGVVTIEVAPNHHPANHHKPFTSAPKAMTPNISNLGSILIKLSKSLGALGHAIQHEYNNQQK